MMTNRRKRNEGEIALCRTMFVVSLRDMLSSGSNYYTKKCKEEAHVWLDSIDETHFSFSNLIDFLYDDEVDAERLRAKLKSMLSDRKVTGTRNLVKILSEVPDDEK